jgi:hypothetical protein
LAAAELATEPVAVVDFLAEATSLLSGATQQQTELLQSIERAQQEVQYLQVCMCVFAFAHVSVFVYCVFTCACAYVCGIVFVYCVLTCACAYVCGSVFVYCVFTCACAYVCGSVFV